jgi:hypothetical protein
MNGHAIRAASAAPAVLVCGGSSNGSGETAAAGG